MDSNHRSLRQQIYSLPPLAIHWARIRTCYFGCTTRDAARIGFDDKMIYESCGRLVRSWVTSVPFLREECLPLFEEWRGRSDRVVY